MSAIALAEEVSRPPREVRAAQPPRSVRPRELAAWLVVVAGAGAWAFWRLHVPALQEPVMTETSAPMAVSLPALDLAAFAAPLWVIPPPPPAPPASPPPPPPLNLQLLAITDEGGVFKASVYDPAADKVLTLGVGDKLGQRMIESVSATAVVFRLNDSVQSLQLERGGAVPGAGRKP